MLVCKLFEPYWPFVLFHAGTIALFGDNERPREPAVGLQVCALNVLLSPSALVCADGRTGLAKVVYYRSFQTPQEVTHLIFPLVYFELSLL